jgi:uncharacterized protein (TIGR02757 family)
MATRTEDTEFRRAMDALCERYRSDEALAADPISVPLAYGDAADREFASWVAAHLAYGRVAPMLNAIRRLLAPMDPRPAQWLRDGSEARIRSWLGRRLAGWAWRFHTLADMVEWVVAWKRMDESTGHSGVRSLLVPDGRRSADEALSALVGRLRGELPDTRGLRFNLPDPLKGSACKRWRMFLRWMARRTWPDLGLWAGYPPSALVVPLDTHVHRISRQIGICRRRTADAKAALEITAALRVLDPEDPLKYDFALAHLGILGDCTGRRRQGCSACPLDGLCEPG